MTNLKKKIIEFRVKTIYLALDNDAIMDAVKISDEFISNGIEGVPLTQSKAINEFLNFDLASIILSLGHEIPVLVSFRVIAINSSFEYSIL